MTRKEVQWVVDYIASNRPYTFPATWDITDRLKIAVKRRDMLVDEMVQRATFPGLIGDSDYKNIERERDTALAEVVALEGIVEGLREVLGRIATGPRPDGTYNLSREACEEIARAAAL